MMCPFFEEYSQRLLISEVLKDFNTTHCPTLFGRAPSVNPQMQYLAEKQHLSEKQQLMSSESALNDSYTLLRELETLALFLSQPLSVFAAQWSRWI